MTMINKENSRNVFTFLFGLLLAFGLVLVVFYIRQQMFTRTEPIVLSG